MVDWELEVCACAVRVRRVNAQGALQDTFRSKYWDDVAMKQTSNLGNFKARAWAVRRGMSLLRRASSSVERKSVTPCKETGCNGLDPLLLTVFDAAERMLNIGTCSVVHAATAREVEKFARRRRASMHRSCDKCMRCPGNAFKR
jgi:hypothetical protein